MRRPSLLFLAVLAACSGDTSPADVNEQAAFSVGGNAPPTVFNVQLRAENEPNPVSTSAALGFAQVMVLDDGTMEFFFTVNNKDEETFTRAHIHKAPEGVNGPIHWDFLEAGNPVASVSDQPSQLRGVARARAAAVLADLLANPDQYYVNVHSTAFPAGAVRGQLR
jgi:hypothetical protein